MAASGLRVRHKKYLYSEGFCFLKNPGQVVHSFMFLNIGRQTPTVQVVENCVAWQPENKKHELDSN